MKSLVPHSIYAYFHFGKWSTNRSYWSRSRFLLVWFGRRPETRPDQTNKLTALRQKDRAWSYSQGVQQTNKLKLGPRIELFEHIRAQFELFESIRALD